MQIATGRFTATEPHTLRGGFTLTRQSHGVMLETSEDFFFDGAPDPGWALGPSGRVHAHDPDLLEIAEATDFGGLPGAIMWVKGKQQAFIPPRIDVSFHGMVILWCRAEGVILGTGRIERAAAEPIPLRAHLRAC